MCGRNCGTRVFSAIQLVRGNREAVATRLEKVINRLELAGFKYKAATGKKNLVSVITQYGKLEVTFVLKWVSGQLEGIITAGKPARHIGNIIAAKCIYILTDIGDDVPSMTLDM